MPTVVSKRGYLVVPTLLLTVQQQLSRVSSLSRLSSSSRAASQLPTAAALRGSVQNGFRQATAPNQQYLPLNSGSIESFCHVYKLLSGLVGHRSSELFQPMRVARATYFINKLSKYAALGRRNVRFGRHIS